MAPSGPSVRSHTMKTRPITRSLVGISTAAALALGATAPASSAKTVLKVNVPKEVDAGKRAAFTYMATGVRGRLVLQRPKGTGKVWSTVQTLKPRRKGKGTLPALQEGDYSYRLAVIRSGRVRQTSDDRRSLVFTDVALGDALVGEQVFQGPTGPFAYADDGRGTFPEFSTIFRISVGESNCRSIRLTWLSSKYEAPPASGTATLRVLTRRNDPQSATAGPESVGTLNARLDVDEPWSIEYRSANPGGDSTVFLNGTVSCYTSTAF